jgi:hypothetical protein
VKRERVRVQALFFVEAAVAGRPVLDAHVAHDLRLVARQLERRQRGVHADDVSAVAVLVNLQVRVTGAAAQMQDARGFAHQQHLLGQLSKKGEVARHDERLQNGGVGRAQFVLRKHEFIEVSDLFLGS